MQFLSLLLKGPSGKLDSEHPIKLNKPAVQAAGADLFLMQLHPYWQDILIQLNHCKF